MNRTLKDIKTNNNVTAIVWNSDLEGCKFIGKASCHNSGDWLEFVKNMPENKGFPAKGALVISVNKAIKAA